MKGTMATMEYHYNVQCWCTIPLLKIAQLKLISAANKLQILKQSVPWRANIGEKLYVSICNLLFKFFLNPNFVVFV